ncbi:MAG: response regulator [Chloroflexota bacterium]
MTRNVSTRRLNRVSGLSRAPRRVAAVVDTNEVATTRRVLVVDDEPAMRRLLRDMFASEGYLVGQAANGAQALQQLQVFRPDIVILDMMMPVMDGLEFVAACRHIDGCVDLPIILLSAMYEDARKASWLPGMGINACLGKPFGVQELLALVELHARPGGHDGTLAVTMLPPDGRLRVLLVLDQPIMAGIAKLTLNHGAYDTRAVPTSAEAAAALATWQPHLVLLDMELEGAKIIQEIGARQSGSAHLPVVGLSRRGDLKSKLAAYELGVQDILTLPFTPEELLARVVAVVRRTYSDTVALTPVIEIGQLEIDILKRTARSGTSELRLTSLEQSLLYLLAANAGRVVSRKEISNTLWGADSVAERGSVDRDVRNLRARLLNISSRQDFIATVPGKGYRFLPTFDAVA